MRQNALEICYLNFIIIFEYVLVGRFLRFEAHFIRYEIYKFISNNLFKKLFIGGSVFNKFGSCIGTIYEILSNNNVLVQVLRGLVGIGNYGLYIKYIC